MRGSAVLFLTLVLLRALTAEANTALSGLHAWLFTGGLFVTYTALMVPMRQGLLVSVLGGLVCDAATPLPFGTHAVLFVIAHILVYNIRERLQRDETAVRVVVALVVNAGLYLAIATVALRHVPSAATIWPRVLSDLLLSEGAVLIVAPWFFALQLRSLELARAVPARSA